MTTSSFWATIFARSALTFEALTPQPPFTDPAGHVMNSLGRTRESRRSGTSTLFFKSVIPDQNIESVQHVDIKEPASIS